MIQTLYLIATCCRKSILTCLICRRYFLACQLMSLTTLFSQMCHLLQYLCDCQVRHRIEAIVAFSDDFVAKLQENQRFRYNEVMQALNMSAALTARKTKEFRSPPQEQVQLTVDSFFLVALYLLFMLQSSV